MSGICLKVQLYIHAIDKRNNFADDDDDDDNNNNNNNNNNRNAKRTSERYDSTSWKPLRRVYWKRIKESGNTNLTLHYL